MSPPGELGGRFFEHSRLLYRGEHIFRTEDACEGTTVLIDREHFWGTLIPFE